MYSFENRSPATWVWVRPAIGLRQPKGDAALSDTLAEPDLRALAIQLSYGMGIRINLRHFYPL